MGTWENNLSYGYTWLVLLNLKQINAVYNDSQEIKMSGLVFYNPTISSDLLRIEATNLAIAIDSTFTNGMGAKLENGISQNQAINSMVEILTNADKTVEDLAVMNDANYLFLNEQV
jgi:hypothetical protein